MWLCLFFFAFASSHHHHLDMNFYYIFLLLLVVLSAYSESPQYGKPPDSLDLTRVTVCPNSSSDSLGVLAPVLPQSEVFGSVQSQNMVLPQNEVYSPFVLLQSEMFRSHSVVLPWHEVFRTVQLQSEVDISVLPQNGVFNVVIVNCQLANKVKVIINFVLNFEVKSCKFLTSTLIHGGEKLGWTIRLLLGSLQHVLKMYM